jgi:hypothetical protein
MNENIFDGYLSDMEDDAFMLEGELEDWYDENHAPLATNKAPMQNDTTEHGPPVTEHSAHKRH